MTQISRRRLFELSIKGGAAMLLPTAISNAGEPKIDLLIRRGTVIDPSQKINSVHDVMISSGKIAGIAKEHDTTRIATVFDAKGMIVVPGLVDLHTHLAYDSAKIGLAADKLVDHTGVTTCVSAGDAGYLAFDDFRKTVLDQMKTRAFAFVHISRIGLTKFPLPEMTDIADAEVDRAAAIVAANADIVLGVKVRESGPIVGNNGLEPLRRAIAAAERAGKGVRVMCHIGGAPGNLSELLGMLRPGDVLTHMYSGAGNNIVVNGKLLDAAKEAKARGVLFDVGHGGGSFDYAILEPALDQGLRPDTISSDLHTASINTPGKPYLPWVMSKFINLGFTLEDVVAMTTLKPASIIGRTEGLGTLKTGAPGDVTILELVDRECLFADSNGNSRKGDRFLVPIATVKAGRLMIRDRKLALPYPA